MVKAAVLEDIRKYAVHNYPKPEVDDNSILIKIDICGVCGTDIHMYEGHMKLPFPVIVGHEFVGTIEEMGDSARNLEVKGLSLSEGDLVTVVPGTNAFCGKCYFCRFQPHKPALCSNRRVLGINMSCRDPPHLFGGYAENIYVDAEHWWVYKIPDGVPPKVAVLTEAMATSTHALERAFAPGLPTFGEGFGLGKSVVVQGVGPIGLGVVATAKIAGAGKIIAIDMVEDRLKIAEKMGSDYIIDMKQFDSSEKRVAEVNRLTDGRGGDVVVECAGVPSAFREGINMTRRGGKYCEVGHYSDPGNIEVNPHVICNKYMDILGVWAYPPTQFDVALQTLRLGIDDFPFSDLITHTFKLSEVENSIKTVKSGKGIKMAIIP